MKIKNREVESTPVTELRVTLKGEGVAMLRLYWTTRPGTYGYQIASQFWDWRNEETIFDEAVTNGCGYCKESHAFDHFLHDLFGEYRGTGGTVNYLLGGTKYRKGGNYYEVPLSVLNKLTKKGAK